MMKAQTLSPIACTVDRIPSSNEDGRHSGRYIQENVGSRKQCITTHLNEKLPVVDNFNPFLFFGTHFASQQLKRYRPTRHLMKTILYPGCHAFVRSRKP